MTVVAHFVFLWHEGIDRGLDWILRVLYDNRVSQSYGTLKKLQKIIRSHLQMHQLTLLQHILDPPASLQLRVNHHRILQCLGHNQCTVYGNCILGKPVVYPFCYLQVITHCISEVVVFRITDSLFLQILHNSFNAGGPEISRIWPKVCYVASWNENIAYYGLFLLIELNQVLCPSNFFIFETISKLFCVNESFSSENYFIVKLLFLLSTFIEHFFKLLNFGNDAIELVSLFLQGTVWNS